MTTTWGTQLHQQVWRGVDLSFPTWEMGVVLELPWCSQLGQPSGWAHWPSGTIQSGAQAAVATPSQRRCGAREVAVHVRHPRSWHKSSVRANVSATMPMQALLHAPPTLLSLGSLKCNRSGEGVHIGTPLSAPCTVTLASTAEGPAHRPHCTSSWSYARIQRRRRTSSTQLLSPTII